VAFQASRSTSREERKAVPSHTSLSVAELSALVGTPDCPVILDVRIDDDYGADPRLIPGSIRRSHRRIGDWIGEFALHVGAPIVVSCQRGLKLSQGVAALLRHEDIPAVSLTGGFEAWTAAGGLLVRTDALPAPDLRGRTVWVTRERPKIDRIACPWLIRRFIDPRAVFLYVAASEVADVADRFAATPYDIDGVRFSHRGEACSFDTLLSEFGLESAPLKRLAAVIRGADTGRPDLAPESAGLLAASLGLSRAHADDLAMLEAGMGLYDAFYRWARDAAGETHNWPAKVAA